MMNQDKYLSLKQGLCIYNAMILKYAVNIDGQQVDIKAMADNLIKQLEGIQQDFTIPFTLLTRKVAVNATLDLESNFNKIISRIDSDKMLQYKLIDLRTAVYDFPNFANLEEKIIQTTELDDENMFYNGKSTVAKIISQIEEGLERLIAAVKISACNEVSFLLMNLLQALQLVNLIHTADWFFNFTNDKWGK
ncbi:hypothetical protein [Aeromonas phage AerS_266]|nr:hypothetical protein [Aeromonas phage AerS_266]